MAKENNNNTGVQYNALTAGSKIIGNIIADTDIRIDGEVEGTLECKSKLVIGERGFLKGTIVCANAEIYGKLEGDITVSETLSLRQSGAINGKVKTKTLLIEPKAIFNGSCSMTEEKATTNNTPKK